MNALPKGRLIATQVLELRMQTDSPCGPKISYNVAFFFCFCPPLTSRNWYVFCTTPPSGLIKSRLYESMLHKSAYCLRWFLSSANRVFKLRLWWRVCDFLLKTWCNNARAFIQQPIYDCNTSAIVCSSPVFGAEFKRYHLAELELSFVWRAFV